MNVERFKKFRRIAAWIGIILLVGMYVVSLIAAMCKSENAHSLFMLSMFGTFVVPVVIYLMEILYKLANKKKDKEAK